MPGGAGLFARLSAPSRPLERDAGHDAADLDNLAYYQELMAGIRAAIAEGRVPGPQGRDERALGRRVMCAARRNENRGDQNKSKDQPSEVDALLYQVPCLALYRPSYDCLRSYTNQRQLIVRLLVRTGRGSSRDLDCSHTFSVNPRSGLLFGIAQGTLSIIFGLSPRVVQLRKHCAVGVKFMFELYLLDKHRLCNALAPVLGGLHGAALFCFDGVFV